MPFFVYVLASKSRTLYTGHTANLARRLDQHRARKPGSFTARYRIVHLVHYEVLPTRHLAFLRERQIKGWSRAKRVALIEAHNAGWLDLMPAHGPPGGAG